MNPGEPTPLLGSNPENDVFGGFDIAGHRDGFRVGSNSPDLTRAQLKLLDAAHILPVGADGSTDLVTNGITLSPTYHRAFDYGLIYLDAQLRMQINPRRVEYLRQLNLDAGLAAFSAPLGNAIHLPANPAQRPSLNIVRRANSFRRIAA